MCGWLIIDLYFPWEIVTLGKSRLGKIVIGPSRAKVVCGKSRIGIGEASYRGNDIRQLLLGQIELGVMDPISSVSVALCKMT